jgi:hypothetical protein
VEIVRNITGIYAVEGYKSIINIITYDNYRGYDFKINAEPFYGLHSTNQSYMIQSHGSATLEATLEKWNFTFGYNTVYDEMAIKNYSKTIYTSEDYTIVNSNRGKPNLFQKSVKNNISFGADYKINKNNIVGIESSFSLFPYSGISNSFSYDTIFTNGNYIAMYNTLKSTKSSNRKYAGAYYKSNFDSSSTLTTYLVYSSTTGEKKQTVNNEQNNNYDNSSQDINYKLQYDKTFLGKITLSAGGRYLQNYSLSKSENSSVEKFSTKSEKYTAFGYLNVKLGKKSSFTAGGAYEIYSAYNTSISKEFKAFKPKLTLQSISKSGGKFELNYEIKTEYPYLTDLSPQATYDRPLIIRKGNPDLSPYSYHKFSFMYSKIFKGFLSYLSIEPYYDFSSDQYGLSVTTQDSIQIYTPVNSTVHEKYGAYSILSFDIKEKLEINLDFDIYKDWNKNLSTPQIIDWNGSLSADYSFKPTLVAGIMYQKEYCSSVNSLGYSKEGINFLMLYMFTLQAKGRLEIMLGYILPINTPENYTYEQTPYYSKYDYSEINLLKNLVMLNITFRLSKGKVNKVEKNIDYENFGHKNTKKIIKL